MDTFLIPAVSITFLIYIPYRKKDTEGMANMPDIRAQPGISPGLTALLRYLRG
jgi:hypothetical protein